MQLTMTAASGGVPVGAYVGDYLGIEPIENEHGLGYKWSWKITQGEHKGTVVCRITDRKVKPTTACGRMLNAIAGRAVAESETINITQFVGKPYTIIVGQGQMGGTRVETVAPITG